MLPEPTTSTPWLRRLRKAAPIAYTSAGPAPTGSATCTTGTSACGSKCIIGTQAPWSKGRAASPCAAMPAAPSNSSTSDANAGEPGAGYCNWYSAGGKPPKSCHVAGCAPAITRGDRAIQWGDITTTPRRPGNCAFSSWPQRVSAGPVSPASSANKGAPCDTNNAGTAAEAGVERAEECVDMEHLL